MVPVVVFYTFYWEMYGIIEFSGKKIKKIRNYKCVMKHKCANTR
jgi:hypothetical protein